MLVDEIEHLSAQVADLTARLDQAQAMILERDERIAQLELQMGQRHDLFTLRNCADRACLEASAVIDQFQGEAINWGDLGCVGAEFYADEFGNYAHRVWIEECDPAAYRLRDFIKAYLERHNFPDVSVMLEW